MALPDDMTEAPAPCPPFSARDIRDATRLLAIIASAERTDEEHGDGGGEDLVATTTAPRRQPQLVSREVLVSRARRHLRERQLRKQFFNRATFGEPAWDTLLVLYISEHSGRRLTIGRLADWIEAPLSTTQRWIGYLEKERLIAKQGHPDDRRIAYLVLLEKGQALLNDYFTAALD